MCPATVSMRLTSSVTLNRRGTTRRGRGACPTSWASYGGEPLLREAVGVPDDLMLAGHVVVGWPRGHHGPVRRRPVSEVVAVDSWDGPVAGDGL